MIGSWSVTILKECDPRDAVKVVEALREAQASQPDLLGLSFTLGAFSESPTAVAGAGSYGDIYFFNHRESGRLFAAVLQEVSETTVKRLVCHELAHVASKLKAIEIAIAVEVLTKPDEVKKQLLLLNESYFGVINKLFSQIDPSNTSEVNADVAGYIAGEAVAEVFACLQTGGAVPEYEPFKNVKLQLRADHRKTTDIMMKPVAYVKGRPIYRFGV